MVTAYDDYYSIFTNILRHIVCNAIICDFAIGHISFDYRFGNSHRACFINRAKQSEFDVGILPLDNGRSLDILGIALVVENTCNHKESCGIKPVLYIRESLEIDTFASGEQYSFVGMYKMFVYKFIGIALIEQKNFVGTP